MRAQPTHRGGVSQTTTLTLGRFAGVRDRLWAMRQMALARGPLRRSGASFFKLFGSGSGAGFEPRPNFGVWGVLAVWPDLETAQARIAEAPVFCRFRARTTETATLYLQAIRARGGWDGAEPFVVTAEDDEAAPLAVLTRATIRPRKALAFWRATGPIHRDVEVEAAMPFRIGLGEAPWIRQVTVSVWTDRAALDAFSTRDQAHGTAARRAYAEHWFSEYLFARFAIRAAEGAWEGRPVLPDAAQALAA